VLTSEMVRYISGLTYKALPVSVVEATKAAVLDCLGVAVAGSGEPPSKVLGDYMRGQGRPEAGVIGQGFKTSADQAAWVNGTIAHALDYDDYFVPFNLTPYHPTVAILPAVLAVSEKHHMSGREVILAYVVGFEVAGKLALLCAQPQYEAGWHTTSTLGSMGAAAAVARLMQLDDRMTGMALGIAASLAGGLRKSFGTMTKPLHAGNAARNGVVAAELAAKGFTADAAILDSPLGFGDVLGGESSESLPVTESQFQITSPGIAFKPYPSCAYTHWAIDAALEIRGRNASISSPDNILAVECRTSSGLPRILIHAKPTTALEGKFSLQYCVAAALMEGKVGLKEFTDAKVNAVSAKALVAKVSYRHPPEMGTGLTNLKGELEVKLKDGSSYSHRVEISRGDPRRPLTWNDLEIKYRDCAGSVMKGTDTDQSLELISNLESVSDVSDLMKIITIR
jgi:2-methylcitrate dehydratase PrpD